jgi:hypothetical protein
MGSHNIPRRARGGETAARDLDEQRDNILWVVNMVILWLDGAAYTGQKYSLVCGWLGEKWCRRKRSGSQRRGFMRLYDEPSLAITFPRRMKFAARRAVGAKSVNDVLGKGSVNVPSR